MNINELRWHDGNISSINIVSKSAGVSPAITISAELYDDTTRSPGRDLFIIKCQEVESMNSICDYLEIGSNDGFGSIHGAELKGSAFRISLYGGYIEIRAKQFTVEKC